MDTVSHKLFKESFLLQKFFEKMESKDVARSKNRKNGHFQISLTSRCASYRGVKGTNYLKKLRGVLPTAESSSAVYFLPRSQTAHRGVKIEILESLWLLLKGQSGEFPLKETILSCKKRFLEKKINYLGLKF